jgi:uncharacterized membrane protein/O-antigen/teichoic acid export membrane protein
MTIVAERLRSRVPVSPGAVRDQVAVASGQIGAGIGNMAFSLLMARLLSPGAFAQFASFLALYLVLSMPGSAVSAAAALEPVGTARARPLLLYGGVVFGVCLAIASPWVGSAFRLPVAMVVVLGLSGPALGTLGLERGRLYARHRHSQLVASLVAEPAVRLLLGLALTLAVGAVGGALAVVVAGYGALEVARRRWAPGRLTASPEAGAPATAPLLSATKARAARWAALAFLALVVVQNQDLLIANRILSPSQAGQFAVLSTLGGLAVFATMTVPLVLLPRSGGEGGGLLPALSLTTLIGAVAVGIVALAPAQLIDILFGSRYREAAGVLVPYMAAMSLLGVARVLVAHRCAIGSGRSTIVMVLGAIAVQATLILSFGRDTRSVAFSTVAAVTGLNVSLGTAEALRVAALRQRLNELVAVMRRPIPATIAVVSGLGLAERFVIPRGLWLDEATSVFEARQGFGQMITTLRTTDVHPPLYFSVLWVTIRAIGDGPLAVRLPSIIAGTLVIPMLYVLGREAYDRRTGVVAAVAGSIAPIMVWYSQEARMYALLMLFAVIALWAQVRILRGGGGRLIWAIYAVASIAMVWTQYFGAFQLVVQQLAFIFILLSKHRRGEPVRDLLVPWVITALAIGACLAPLLPFAYQQFMVNQTAGKGFGGPTNVGNPTALSGNQMGIYTALANLIWAVWGYQPYGIMVLLAAMWPLGMLFALVLLGRRHQRITTLFVLAILGPGLALFLLGMVKRDLFDIRYLSTTVPVLFVLTARLLTAIPRRFFAVVAGTAILVASLLAGLIDQQYNGANPRTYDFSGALASIEAQARPGDIVYYDPTDLREVVEYYGPHLKLKALTAVPSPPAPGHLYFIVASPSLMNGSSNVAVLSHTVSAMRSHHRLLRHQKLSNVETWEFR